MIIPYNIQHVSSLNRKDLVALFADPVVIEEKYDGFSVYFRLDEDGELEVATKKRQNVHLDPMNFAPLMPTLREVIKPRMSPGLTYYCEFINQQQMVDMHYDNVPENNLVLWDVWDEDNQEWLAPETKADEAYAVGVHEVSYWGALYPLDVDAGDFWQRLTGFAHTPSSLGGYREGIVVKNYERMRKGFPLTGKLVV